jgi:hypothetical protein
MTDLVQLSQYKKFVVVPTLQILGKAKASLNNQASINLLTGTALVESDLTYIYQVPNGPAIGLDQMEPLTLEDQFSTFLDYPANYVLRASIESLSIASLTYEQNLYGNAFFACAMARIKYYRSPDPLPNATDAQGLADYHKSIYNSALGAADVVANTAKFQLAISA